MRFLALDTIKLNWVRVNVSKKRHTKVVLSF